jgi:hypothetical protein
VLFMLALLHQRDDRLLAPYAHLERCSTGTDGEFAVTEASGQVEGFTRRLLAREPQCVLRHRGLDRRSHRGGGTEEAICRGESLEPLVRALEVVVLHEELHAPLAVLEVGKHGARQELLPQGLPEALDLAAGLRVMRAALHVTDAMAPELLLELGGPAPRGVLAPLVGQDLPRCSIVGNASRQGLQHQGAALVMRHGQTHQITRVIVEKGGHVQPLMPAQQEGEQIRLPQLVGLGTFEAMLAWLGLRLGSRGTARRSFTPQHAPHRGLGGTDPQEALHHIADATAAGLRLLRLRGKDRGTSCRTRGAVTRAGTTRSWPHLETLRPALAIAPRPLNRCGVRHAQLCGDLIGTQVLIHHRSCQAQAYIRRPALSVLARRPACRSPALRLVLARHLSHSSVALCQATR